MMKVALSGKAGEGKFALVDDEYYDHLSGMVWYLHNTGYAFNPRATPTVMHRHILPCPDHLFTDHKNGDRLDNRLCNLRVATAQQNTHNAKKHKDSLSCYKGVVRIPNTEVNPWAMRLHVAKGVSESGRFPTEIAAAIAYDAVALRHHGEFAWLNFPDSKTPVSD